MKLAITPTTSSGGGTSVIPLIIANGVTFTVATNTQVVYANAIIIQAGGVILTSGTSVLTYVN